MPNRWNVSIYEHCRSRLFAVLSSAENSVTEFGHVPVEVTINGIMALDCRQMGGVCVSKVFGSSPEPHPHGSAVVRRCFTQSAPMHATSEGQFGDHSRKLLTAMRQRQESPCTGRVILDESEKERACHRQDHNRKQRADHRKNVFECVHYGKRYRDTGSSLVRVDPELPLARFVSFVSSDSRSKAGSESIS